MRVGVLTSWRVPCGIYQYSSRLIEALSRIPDVEPVVLAGRADEHRSVPEEMCASIDKYDVAKIGMWRDDRQYDIDMDTIWGLNLGVLHVQYEQMLYHWQALRVLTSNFPGVSAITYHDKCIPPGAVYDGFDLHFSHRWDVGPTAVEHLPFGVEKRAPVVRTFGLGRTRSDYIRPICERHGWVFETIASHEPIHGGGQQWRSHGDLIEWLRGADAIVLWYDDADMAGESQAARTAMAARRPVFVNDVTWFGDLPKRTQGFQKVQTLGELEEELCVTLTNNYIMHNSWDKISERLVERYKHAISHRRVSTV